MLATSCECLPCLARFPGCVLSISTSNTKCDSGGLWEDQGGSWSRRLTRKPWLPRTRRAFPPAGSFCPCLHHAHEDPVVANHADGALSPFHQVQTEREEEKKTKQASLKQIPINPAVQTVIVLPTSPAPCPRLCKAPSSSSLGAVMRGAPQLLFKAYQG